MTENYVTSGPSREEIDLTARPMLLEFGADWCGHCQAAVPAIATALSEFQSVPRVRVEDGPGRRLGRSFRVKLWPALVFLKDGVEIAQLVRPVKTDEIRSCLGQIAWVFGGLAIGSALDRTPPEPCCAYVGVVVSLLIGVVAPHRRPDGEYMGLPQPPSTSSLKLTRYRIGKPNTPSVPILRPGETFRRLSTF